MVMEMLKPFEVHLREQQVRFKDMAVVIKADDYLAVEFTNISNANTIHEYLVCNEIGREQLIKDCVEDYIFAMAPEFLIESVSIVTKNNFTRKQKRHLENDICFMQNTMGERCGTILYAMIEDKETFYKRCLNELSIGTMLSPYNNEEVVFEFEKQKFFFYRTK
jgi:hypothetical protein